eukprot:11420.XXX_223568_223747_1 [CDS] Oithona nana genome sequencing.
MTHQSQPLFLRRTFCYFSRTISMYKKSVWLHLGIHECKPTCTLLCLQFFQVVKMFDCSK